MARATFAGVGKAFGGVTALAHFSLEVADGELITVLGPSGCGKSTLLRVTAGLEELSSGSIALDGERIDRLPPHARDVAMVFQSYALYPHMTVRGNVEFPLRMRGLARGERHRRVEEVTTLLELSPLLDRRPAELSGGQRQRVALARALVRRPKLFLLDEPLSNVDARLRASVRQYIRDMQRRLGVTTLYVTHDQVEAMTLGDRVVVLDGGRMQQVGAPLDIYERPATTFVAGFVGTPPMNLVEAEYAAGVLAIGDQRLPVTPALSGALPERAGPVVVGIRPEAFVPLEGEASDALIATPDATTREILGSETLVRAALGQARVIVRLPGIVRDVPARVAAPVASVHVFGARDGARLGP
jgi:ABC-type sugar transport system ATPase subunit